MKKNEFWGDIDTINPQNYEKLPEINPSNPRAARFKRGIAEAFHLMHVAELLADELAQDAVAFAV